MSILKYVDRLKRMDDLIRRKATGTPEQFAEMLQISPSQLYSDLKEMRQMGAPIQYSETRKSYVYEKSCKLILDFHTEAQSVKGGIQFSPLFYSLQ
jgi:predicted DNA-binding transcriptional regulator YafY